LSTEPEVPGDHRIGSVGRFDLVIFDCDGVLVDSERLAVRTEARILASLGWPITETEIVDRFVGRSAQYMQREVELAVRRSVDWETEFEPLYRQVFENELVPVDGIFEALDSIDLPTCVASSGSHDKMAFTLGLVGLLDRFDGHIFSATEVDHGKPAPDVFLHAAERMGAEAHRCAVVEDSVSGVSAGLAAGMTVFGFAGGVTGAAQLAKDGVTVFDHMRALPDLVLSGRTDGELVD
jgi:HAD superfamily hydrolase (TIGR01509 family)